MSNKTVLVTGAGGFIGSHIVLELLRENYSVVAIDNMANCFARGGQMPESLKRVEAMTGKKVIFHDMDVKYKNPLRKLFKSVKIDYVLHTAALKLIMESVTSPLKFYRSNVAGTIALTEVMDENNVKRLVYSSSSTVYGKPLFQPITETHPTGNCKHPYGTSKFVCEEIFKDLCKASPEWTIVCLRYFKPVSADESGMIGEDPLGIPKVIMPFLAQVAAGKRKKLKVFGGDYATRDGTGIRDYVHVTDVAKGNLKVLEKIDSPSFRGWKAYNMATGIGHTVLELVRTFSKSCGKPIPYEILGRREGDVDEYYADISLAKKELGWIPAKTIKQMCDDAWNWQSKNPNGYR